MIYLPIVVVPNNEGTRPTAEPDTSTGDCEFFITTQNEVFVRVIKSHLGGNLFIYWSDQDGNPKELNTLFYPVGKTIFVDKLQDAGKEFHAVTWDHPVDSEPVYTAHCRLFL